MSRKVFYIVTLVLLLSSCSAYKYVPEGEYLLRKTSVKTDIPKEDLGNANLKQYLRQTPNSRIFGVFPMSLTVEGSRACFYTAGSAVEGSRAGFWLRDFHCCSTVCSKSSLSSLNCFVPLLTIS